MSDAVAVSTLVEAISEQLASSYIYPDRAVQATILLHSNFAAGHYNLPVGPDLCVRLSDDLYTACADKHLRLIWYESAETSQDEQVLVAEIRDLFQRENYGIRKVERLGGNVGRIEFTLIPEAALGGAAMAAAMQLVAHTQALILDLRETRGGSPGGVAFLCSFFFGDEEVHLNDVVEGPQGPTQQFWTVGYLPAPRYLDRPVYILTSSETFSGGEELAYDLQALGRAIVVGGVTRGGAHPSKPIVLAEHIELRLPVARAVNPTTGGNWEAVGVQPDLAVPAAEALTVAQRAALERIASHSLASSTARQEARQFLDQGGV